MRITAGVKPAVLPSDGVPIGSQRCDRCLQLVETRRWQAHLSVCRLSGPAASESEQLLATPFVEHGSEPQHEATLDASAQPQQRPPLRDGREVETMTLRMEAELAECRRTGSDGRPTLRDQQFLRLAINKQLSARDLKDHLNDEHRARDHLRLPWPSCPCSHRARDHLCLPWPSCPCSRCDHCDIHSSTASLPYPSTSPTWPTSTESATRSSTPGGCV